MKWETKTSENMKIRRKRLSKTKTMNEGECQAKMWTKQNKRLELNA